MQELEAALVTITSEVWTSVLSLGVQSVRRKPPLPPPSSGLCTGSIRISGAWSGAVSIEAPVGLVRRAAAIMFGMREAELSSAEFNDAFGEITNMVGGTIKALLPNPSQISLPTVALSPAPATDAAEVARAVFLSEGHFFAVLLSRDRQLEPIFTPREETSR